MRRLQSGNLETAVFVALAVLLPVAAARNVHALNPDGIAYVRIGEYIARGDFRLAVSGYWSPLFSWAIALLLRFGSGPITAARVAMATSAFVFVAGCTALLRRFELPRWKQTAGTLLAALSALSWSVEFITPDLLVAGLLCAGVSMLLQRREPTVLQGAVAGALFGVACLAKAVALPFAALAIAAFAIMRLRRLPLERRAIVRSAVVTVAVCMALAGPWMVVLSRKYGHFVFSTTAAINHAVAGPPNVERDHPFIRTIHHPEPGRVTSWEDPSDMPYAQWSPLDSAEDFRYQLALIGRNLWTFVRLLDQFGGAIPIVALCCLSLLVKHAKPGSGERIPLWWAFVPVVILVALYAPLHIDLENLRFFYALLPFLYAIAVSGADWLFGRASLTPAFRVAGYAIVLLLFFWAPAVRGAGALRGNPNRAGEEAFEAAGALRRAGLVGPVVGGAAGSSGAPGLYVAFLLDQPWDGDLRQPTAAAYRSSGARIAVVHRWSAIEAELADDPRTRDLDPIVIPSRPGPVAPMIHLFELSDSRGR